MSAVNYYKERVLEVMKGGNLNALKPILAEIEADKTELDDVSENIRGLLGQLKYFASGNTAEAAKPVAAPKPTPKPAPKPEPKPAPAPAPEPELVIEDTPELVIEMDEEIELVLDGAEGDQASGGDIDFGDILGDLGLPAEPEPEDDGDLDLDLDLGFDLK